MANSDSWNRLVAALTGPGAGHGMDQLTILLRAAESATPANGGEGIEQVRAADQEVAAAITRNLTAVVENTSATASGSGWGLKSVGSLLGNGLGATPLIGGLVKLFGGGGGAEVLPPLMEYSPPAPLRFEGAVDRSAGYTEWSQPEATGRGRSETVAMPQVTVQVTAMDSRSFLDHSDDIARAVRQAMLNSHGLNDVVSEI